jgi:hypothetical protein
MRANNQEVWLSQARQLTSLRRSDPIEHNLHYQTQASELELDAGSHARAQIGGGGRWMKKSATITPTPMMCKSAARTTTP